MPAPFKRGTWLVLTMPGEAPMTVKYVGRYDRKSKLITVRAHHKGPAFVVLTSDVRLAFPRQ